MPTDTALDALRYFADRCGDAERPVVSFYGGEPLLNFELIRAVVAEARAHPGWPELHFMVSTNGTLLDDEKIAFLSRERFDVQISLDGPAALHDRYRVTADGRETHGAIVDNLRALLRRDPAAARRLSFMVTLAPPYDFLGVAEFFREFPPFRELGIEGQPHAQINIVDLTGLDIPRQRELLMENLTRAAARYRDICVAGERDDAPAALLRFFDQDIIGWHHRPRGEMGDTFRPCGVCMPGLRRLHVKVDGSYQPCERVGEGLVIGDVAGGIDLDAADGLFARMLDATDGRCRDCWALRLCDVCFVSLAEEGQRKIPEHVCEYVRRKKETTLRLYLSLQEHGLESLAFLKNSAVM